MATCSRNANVNPVGSNLERILCSLQSLINVTAPLRGSYMEENLPRRFLLASDPIQVPKSAEKSHGRTRRDED